MTVPLQSLIVTTKNHVDIGFTASEAKVLHDACRWLLPTAAVQFKKMREAGEPMTWCVPAAIATLALEWLEGAALRDVEQGFAAGDLAWHALPFTTHTELLDESLIEALTGMARRLDERFGFKTTCAKLTDVPSHTIGIVGPLARAGIQCLHIGVNWMSPSPDIPLLSRWRDYHGNELVLKLEPKGYGGEIRLPNEAGALLWNLVGDNMEVPSEADLRATMASLRTQHPNATVRGGRPEDWAGLDLLDRAADLPVVSVDLGDSWIFGTGSDPWKMQRYRELARLRREWLAAHRLAPASKVWIHFDRALLSVAEHTWGGAVAAWSHHNRTHWNNVDFAWIRSRGCWTGLAASWQEKRDHLDNALQALAGDPALLAEAREACAACVPQPFDPNGWTPMAVDEAQNVDGTVVKLDSRGAVISLHDGEERIRGASGLLRYQTFDAADCRRAVAEYSTFQAEWLLEEFAKMGLEGTEAVSKMWEPRVLSTWRRGHSLAVVITFPEEAVTKAGAPRSVTLTYTIGRGRLEGRVDWFGKYPTRLPEVVWWSFEPLVADPRQWRLDKSGHWIDPCSIPMGGGRWLHGVQSGAKNGHVRLLTRDAHLLAVGEPMLYRFPRAEVDPAKGLHLNLVNNLWGTNFPQWCGDDLAFRTALVWT